MSDDQNQAAGMPLPVPVSAAEVAALFDGALAQHQSQAFEQAQALYRQVLAARPEHVAALSNLGTFRGREGSRVEIPERIGA